MSQCANPRVPNRPIRVLIADNQAVFRRGIRTILDARSDITVVGEADNGRTAAARSLLLSPDIVLMDLDMPSMNGIEAARMIKNSNPNARIILFTETQDTASLFHAIEAGVCGYVLKNVEPAYLVDSVLRVYAGDTIIPDHLSLKIISEFPGPGTGYRGMNLRPLTDKEEEILRRISHGATNKEIAMELRITENTVRNHIRRIFQKLNVHNRSQAAATAVRVMKYGSIQR